MGFNSTDLLPLIIEKVNPRITKAFEEGIPFLKKLSAKTPIETNNRGVRLVSRVRRNANFIWYDQDGGGLPADGTSTYVDLRVFYAPYVIAGGFTKAALNLDNTKALINLVTQRMDDDKDSMMKFVEQQIWENGDARLGSVTSFDAGANTVVCAGVFGSTRFQEGYQINFYAPDGTIHDNTFAPSTVTIVTGSTDTLTFDDLPSDIANGDIMTFRGSFGRGIHGHPYHISAGSGFWQGQSRGTYKEFKSTVFDAQSAFVSPANLDRTLTLNEYKMGTDVSQGDFQMWSAPCQWRQYMQNGYTFLQFAANGTSGGGKYNGTFADGVQHGGIPWNKSVDCPDDVIYGDRMDDFGWYELEKPQVLKDDGLTMRLIPDFAQSVGGSYKAGLVYYIGGAGDLGIQDPRKHFSLINLATTNGATRRAALA